MSVWRGGGEVCYRSDPTNHSNRGGLKTSSGCKRNPFGLQHEWSIGAGGFCLSDARYEALLVVGQSKWPWKEYSDAADNFAAAVVWIDAH